MIHRRAPITMIVGALLIATACSGQSAGRPARTVVVTHTVTPPAQTGAGTSTPATPSGSPSPAMVTKLPGVCDDLLPLAAIDNALGHSVHGQTSFVVGLPEKDIGRLGYLNCRYGLGPGGKGTPKVEIGVSLYGTPAQAAARIPATVDAYVAHGASSAKTTIDGQQATILTGGSGSGYALPTLVLSDGQRTVAVTVDESAGARARKDLTALAELALKRTAAN